MNMTDRRLPLFVCILLFSAATLHAQAQQQPFDRLINRFTQGEVFNSQFSHQYVDSYTGDTVATSGTIWVGKNKYKVQNQQQIVVVDGQTSKVYDENRNRVIISKYEPEDDDFAPSRFLNGTDTTYTVQQQQQSGSETVIELVSSDPFSIFRQVDITLGSGLIPQKIFAQDQAENLITTTFTSGAFIEPDTNLFQLSYPDDAEIVDMRN